MAQRRMFSQRIVESARFLKMPPSTQCLYFHLGIHADDDGVVEGYNVMKQTGSTEDDLKILAAKGLITVLNSDLVTYINDWKENNRIRSDRKVDSIYRDLLIRMLPDIELQQSKARADTGKKTGIKAIEDNGRPVDNQWTSNGPHRLGKDRLGKDSINNIVDSSESPTQIYESEFEQLWSMYPKKQGKKAALRHYKTWRKRSKDNTFEAMKEKLEHYLKFLKIKQTPLEYTLNGSTWFNGRFDDELDMTPVKPRYNQQAKTIRKATDWSKYQQRDNQSIMSIEERNKIFREFGDR
ncbi:hypothetical protein [Lactobacillus paragasseri]|uniref:Uncharacterized protein n=1 Tax=Lactobacillus paragasseri TaxID=2107999 RepID=A0ABD4ZZ94_9LACO|nr:hypothetical protein [Lactobacillus paragasseri]MDK7952174.1 hypothetical protein [Lactobacillus paragasseri]MDO6360828.1 hypothetical protein [Lactobacillus paragasseri]